MQEESCMSPWPSSVGRGAAKRGSPRCRAQGAADCSAQPTQDGSPLGICKRTIVWHPCKPLDIPVGSFHLLACCSAASDYLPVPSRGLDLLAP